MGSVGSRGSHAGALGAQVSIVGLNQDASPKSRRLSLCILEPFRLWRQSALPRSTAIRAIFARLTEEDHSKFQKQATDVEDRPVSNDMLLPSSLWGSERDSIRSVYPRFRKNCESDAMRWAFCRKLRTCGRYRSLRLVALRSRELLPTLGGSSSRSIRTTFSVYTGVPWPYESFCRREPRLSLRGSDCEFRILSGL